MFVPLRWLGRVALCRRRNRGLEFRRRSGSFKQLVIPGGCAGNCRILDNERGGLVDLKTLPQRQLTRLRLGWPHSARLKTGRRPHVEVHRVVCARKIGHADAHAQRQSLIEPAALRASNTSLPSPGVDQYASGLISGAFRSVPPPPEREQASNLPVQARTSGQRSTINLA
jgi:hypothetical protein